MKNSDDDNNDKAKTDAAIAALEAREAGKEESLFLKTKAKFAEMQMGADGKMVPVPSGRLFTVHAFAPKGVRDRTAEALFIPGARLGLEHAEAVTKCAELNDAAFDKPGEPHIWFGVVRFDEKDFAPDATPEGT